MLLISVKKRKGGAAAMSTMTVKVFTLLGIIITIAVAGVLIDAMFIDDVVAVPDPDTGEDVDPKTGKAFVPVEGKQYIVDDETGNTIRQSPISGVFEIIRKCDPTGLGDRPDYLISKEGGAHLVGALSKKVKFVECIHKIWELSKG